jgi:hypothetical protein
MSHPVRSLVALALFAGTPALALAGVVPPPTAPAASGAAPKTATPPATAPAKLTPPTITPPALPASATAAPTDTPPNLLGKQQAMMAGNTRYPETLPMQGETTRQERLAKEAAQVWARQSARNAHPASQSFSQPAESARASGEAALKAEDAKFRQDVQGRIYDVPAGRFYLTIEASAPIRQMVIPPDSHVARAKYLPHQKDEIVMLRFRKDAAYHPVQVTLSFPGGVRTLYLLPKPMLVGRTIRVEAPRYLPDIPLRRNLSGNPNSRFLPAIRAVWEHAENIPGFHPYAPPRHSLSYGRFKLVPRFAWSGESGADWMILWKMVSIHRQVSNVSPAQFSGPGILAVSLTGTRVSADDSPYLLTVEGAEQKQKGE